MKKIQKVMYLMIILIFLHVSVVTADTGGIDEYIGLTSDKSSLKINEEVIITFSKISDDYFGGISAQIEYDNTILELLENNVTSGWNNLNQENKSIIEVVPIDNSIKNVTQLKFKALANSTTNKISLKNIKIYDEYGNILKEFAEKSINIAVGEEDDVQEKSLSEIVVSKVPTKVTYKVGEKFDPSGMIITAKYSDSTANEISSYTYSPNTELSQDDKEITISYTENNITKTVKQSITVENAQDNNTSDVTGIKLNITESTLPLLFKLPLTLEILPKNATKIDIIWTSSNEKIAKFEKSDSNGAIVIPVSVGDAVITAKTKDGKYSASCKVKVTSTGDIKANTTKNTTTNTTTNTSTNKNVNTQNVVDNTTSNSTLPKTGSKTFSVILIMVSLCGIVFVSYKEYKKYKEI